MILTAGMIVPATAMAEQNTLDEPTPGSSETTDATTQARERLAAAITSAQAEQKRHLDYPDTVDTHAFTAALATATTVNANTDADADEMNKAAAHLTDAMRPLLGASEQQTRFTQALTHAQSLEGDRYLPTGWAALQATIAYARAMSADTATASQFDTMTKRLRDAVAGLVTASWTFQGEPLHYDEATDSFPLDLSHDPDDQLTVTGPDGTSFSLSGPEAVFVQGTESLGVGGA